MIAKLAPERHRARYADQQTAMFVEVWTHERPSGALSKAFWVAGLFVAAAMAAVGVHRDERHSRAGRSPLRRSSGPGGHMWNDVRFTLRGLRRSPWYFVTAVGVMALTLALATTVFAVVDGVLFRPLGYPSTGNLMVIEPGFQGFGSTYDQPGTRSREIASEVDIDNWQAAVPEAQFTGYRAQPWLGMGEGVNDDPSGVALVDANFFDVIGVAPMIGGFVAEDFAIETLLRPVVISSRLWQARFEGDPNVIGREIVTNPVRGAGYRVVGIMPAGFVFPENTMFVDFIAPFIQATELRSNPAARTVAMTLVRVPDGMSMSMLAQRLQPGLQATQSQFPLQGPRPDGYSDYRWRRQGPYDVAFVHQLSKVLGRDSRQLFQAVFLAVALLVGLASINLSSLMSARIVERRRELDVRRALGASWGAIGRLLFVEAGVLMVMGAGLGVLAAAPCLQFALTLVPEDTVLLKRVALDWRVGGFAGLTVMVLTVMTAAAPFLRSRGQPLRTHATAGASERTRTLGRFIAVSAQVAGAFVLTVVGALLVGSVLVVYAIERPIHTDDMVLINVGLQGPGASMDISEERNQRAQRLLERLEQLPGVRSVAMTASQLLVGGGEMSWFTRTPSASRLNLDTQAVTPGFYRTLEPELVAGRLPTEAELATDAPVVVIGESVARAFWPDAPPVRQTLVDQRTALVFEVVGVVRDVRWTAWDQETASIYGPYNLLSRAPWMNFLIRTDGQTGRVQEEALRVIAETDSLAVPRRTGTLDDQFRQSIQMRRFQSWFFGLFAAASLAVVGVGILGLLAMSAARRTKEIGIRCALGATRAGVLRWLWFEEQVPVLVGLVIGAGLSIWAGALVKSSLYGVTPTDPRVWAAAMILIVTTAGVGAFFPAWRASRTDPLKALRTE